MRLRLVARVLSLVSLVVSLCMVFPMMWSAADRTDDIRAFAASLACGITISYALFMAGGGRIGSVKRGDYEELGIREAFAVVGLSWVIASAVGALPYLFSGALSSYTDAFFESISGFTATGASVIADVEVLPRGILFWRGLTHWLGGMGIIVLSLAVLPFLGVGGMELYKAEFPGPTPEKLTPRVQQMALLLWEVYLFLTCAETFFLMLGGMDFFDALVHSFGTVATGGFSTKNASIAHYGSPYIEWVVTFFMLASGVSFSLYLLILAGFWDKARRNEEFLLYARLFLAATLLIAAVLFAGGFCRGVEHSLRAAAFQTAGFMTTTGFTSENYIAWPYFTRFIILLLAFIGGCAGSTGGGLKVARVLMLARCMRVELLNKLHPNAVLHARVNGKVVSPRVMNGVMAFFTLYVMLFVGATLMVIAMGNNELDVAAAVSGVAASLTNTGPGLDAAGVPEIYAWVPAGVK